jgi:2-dehydro-3-deoxygluconokinase
VDVSAGDRASVPVVGTIGEGLLEVGVDPALAAEHLGRGYGGDAANVAVMAARLGAHARLLTRVGDDAAGRLLLDFWRRNSVDVRSVDVDAGAATGLYLNERGENGDHRFSYHRTGSAASRLSAADADSGFVDGLDALHVTGITLAISPSAAETAERAVERARAAGAMISFAVNLRPQLAPDRPRIAALARNADILFMSVEDAEGLLGQSSPERIIAALGSRARETVITRGAGPALLVTGDGDHRLQPPRVAVVDTAGAGDALAGAYLASRLAGADPREALAHGVAAGALSCRGAGCAGSYPSRSDVLAAAAALVDGGRRAHGGHRP